MFVDERDYTRLNANGYEDDGAIVVVIGDDASVAVIIGVVDDAHVHGYVHGHGHGCDHAHGHSHAHAHGDVFAVAFDEDSVQHRSKKVTYPCFFAVQQTKNKRY